MNAWLVGGSGAVVNFAVFNVLLHGNALLPGSGRQALVASVLASLVAVGANHLLLRSLAHRDHRVRPDERPALFFAFRGIGVAMESGLFYVGYHGLGLHGPLQSNAVKAVSLVLASAFRFLVRRTWAVPQEALSRS
ncbi:GtrA family protein [Streptomyces sp. Act143]|uniref:GtrA family protein n=1 Tax=Streptomyces sp. Act143 TaxID=2200760 RepID=UPI000D6806BD|nr:GtrA family protein [Streptomyces sp. Act143]PWI17893.1 GtrA family protein [Streptomyces sp. Act143]